MTLAMILLFAQPLARCNQTLRLMRITRIYLIFTKRVIIFSEIGFAAIGSFCNAGAPKMDFKTTQTTGVRTLAKRNTGT